MSHDTCVNRIEKFIGYDDKGNKVYEVTRYFKELSPETHRYTVPKDKEVNSQSAD